MHFLRGTTGTQRGLTEVEDFIFLETELAPAAEVRMHTHENATIVLILSGQYRETFRGESEPHPPMTVVAKPAGERHANDIGIAGARCLVIELTEARSRDLMAATGASGRPIVVTGGPASYAGLRIVQELRRPSALTPLALESAALELAAELGGKAVPVPCCEPGWMTHLLEHVHTTPFACLRLSDLARPFGIHPIHLARSFRRSRGCSVGEYARRLQVDRTVAMLAGTTLPLTEVALAAGFYDQSHMGRAVKRQTGLSAGQIRIATG